MTLRSPYGIHQGVVINCVKFDDLTFDSFGGVKTHTHAPPPTHRKTDRIALRGIDECNFATNHISETTKHSKEKLMVFES